MEGRATQVETGPRRAASAVLQFLGAARTVTGSRFLVTGPEAEVLVDCGLFQGLKADRLRNWAPFPADPAALDAVLLTHAHLDHCGYLPALVRAGFRGRVLATRGTRDLARVILTDSARIQEDDAAYANRHGYSKHAPALPLYDGDDARAALERFEVVDFHERLDVAPGIAATFRPAGHILGSASLLLEVASARSGGGPRRVVFSGDLGRPHHDLLVPPAPPPAADALIVESTYGDRRHDDADVAGRLAEIVTQTARRGGVVVVPAFAVDRTELVLRLIRSLRASGSIPDVPVFVDSPMALAALEVYRRAIREGWADVRPDLHGDERPFETGEVTEVRTVDESRALVERRGAALVISASGMATGGRVLHHLRERLPDPANAVVLVGYQAIGTRGRRLLEGASVLKLLGQYVPVRARIHDVSSLSVHADRAELIDWVASAEAPPPVAFVVHGEEPAAFSLREGLAETLDVAAVVPRDGERVRI